MRARPALVGAAALLAVGAWWLSSGQTVEPVARTATSAASSNVVLREASPITASVAAPRPAPELDAEELLRRLEPMAVTDKPRALALALEADAQLSERGVLAEARRALIVTLLVDTQRMPEARDRAREFIRNYAQSRYLPLVQGVTGLHPRPSPRALRDAR